MRTLAIGLILLCPWLLVPAQSRADTVYLKNGNQIEGIITRETEEFVYIQMPGGSMSLSKSAIESIQRSPAEAIEQTKKKWERERRRKERESAARARFEERQRAKGLVKYKGTWVTPDKLAELEQMEKKTTGKGEVENELATLKKEMELLKEENFELRRELTRLRTQQSVQAEEQLKLTREMLQKQRENLEFQKEAEKRSLGQRPPHIWVSPKIDQFTRYPTPSE